MAHLIVHNLNDDVMARLERRAAHHRRSLEEEVREILQDAVGDDRDSIGGLGTRIAQRFAGRGIDFEIPEFRGEQARSASFQK